MDFLSGYFLFLLWKKRLCNFLSKSILKFWFLDIFKMSNFTFLAKSFLKKRDFLKSLHYRAIRIFWKTGPLHKFFAIFRGNKTHFTKMNKKSVHFCKKHVHFCKILFIFVRPTWGPCSDARIKPTFHFARKCSIRCYIKSYSFALCWRRSSSIRRQQ